MHPFKLLPVVNSLQVLPQVGWPKGKGLESRSSRETAVSCCGEEDLVQMFSPTISMTDIELDELTGWGVVYRVRSMHNLGL